MTELAVAYLAFIGLIGAYVYRLLSRLADVDSRLAAAENTLSSDENE
jgi:hypothetical protein|tara:strand:+ start:998 stop:1138 length:141 start_codon:yes stop_codon:yes gene_type:complete